MFGDEQGEKDGVDGVRGYGGEYFRDVQGDGTVGHAAGDEGGEAGGAGVEEKWVRSGEP